MSLLTIVQDAATRLGINKPTSVVSSTDVQVIELLAIANEEGKSLMRRHPWQELTKEKTFTSTAAAVQASSVASDFNRFVDESFFNRTLKRPVFGPISAQDWQFTQAVVATTLVESFRLRGGSLLITPTPANTSTTYAYEYISNQWCQSSGGSPQAAWAADSDTGVLSEEVMTLGVMWRFMKAKGFDYAEAFRSYEMRIAETFATNGGRRTLNMASKNARGMARMPFLQEGSWNL